MRELSSCNIVSLVRAIILFRPNKWLCSNCSYQYLQYCIFRRRFLKLFSKYFAYGEKIIVLKENLKLAARLREAPHGGQPLHK
jgi:hypothetical protein